MTKTLTSVMGDVPVPPARSASLAVNIRPPPAIQTTKPLLLKHHHLNAVL